MRVMFVVWWLVAVGSTVEGEKLQVSCAVPLQANVTLPTNPGVAFTVAVSVPLPPRGMVSVGVLSVPL